MKFALLSNCPGVLLLHNHPSGNVLPSKEDEKTTLRVKDAGSLLGIDSGGSCDRGRNREPDTASKENDLSRRRKDRMTGKGRTQSSGRKERKNYDPEQAYQ